MRFLAGAGDVKTRNVERAGHGTLPAEVTEGNTRLYASVSGPVSVHRPPALADLRALDTSYGD